MIASNQAVQSSYVEPHEPFVMARKMQERQRAIARTRAELHAAIHHLRQYRNGTLSSTQLNDLHGRAAQDIAGGHARGAGRHWVIQDLLIRDVLDADTTLKALQS